MSKSTKISPRGSKKTGGRCKPAYAVPALPASPPPTGKTPNPEAFKRGHGMGDNFLGEFGPDEMRDALKGFHAAVRDRLKEQIAKGEAHLEHLHDAMEVAEDR